MKLKDFIENRNKLVENNLELLPNVSNSETAVCKNCGYTSTPDMVKWHGDGCKNMINKQTDY